MSSVGYCFAEAYVARKMYVEKMKRETEERESSHNEEKTKPRRRWFGLVTKKKIFPGSDGGPPAAVDETGGSMG
ncbi:hypothetical protein QJS10_CPA09g00482 [Acorus calamus]|uniref:Uncharacterized protein n=1 Tax=Acorus calamus TaxID=4465 RepID=A0AAV9E699_ACOCL|nr:hypothetical protein QJS10_CPA09g00482 [Acorus calamus]